jgi:very-short-patch-repair endonuclease
MAGNDFVSAARTSKKLGDVAHDAMLAMRGERPERQVLADMNAGLGISTDIAIEHASERASRLGLGPAAFASAIERGKGTIEKGAALCESPIEKHVLPWLVFENYDALLTFPALVHDVKADRLPPRTAVMIVPQLAFVRFRVDFALVGRWKGKTKIVAVECDGAGYHGAARDRARDEYLAAWGIETVRAMGSEIKHDPRCLTSRAARLLVDWAVQP